MVIGAFFSEVGTDLLKKLAAHDSQAEDLRAALPLKPEWPRRRLLAVRAQAKRHPYKVEIARSDFAQLSGELHRHRDFLLRLLENPNLLDHEAFTAALRAGFHLLEELDYRDNFAALPDADMSHLAGDARRAYALLVNQWLDYMAYLKEH